MDFCEVESNFELNRVGIVTWRHSNVEHILLCCVCVIGDRLALLQGLWAKCVEKTCDYLIISRHVARGAGQHGSGS